MRPFHEELCGHRRGLILKSLYIIRNIYGLLHRRRDTFADLGFTDFVQALRISYVCQNKTETVDHTPILEDDFSFEIPKPDFQLILFMLKIYFRKFYKYGFVCKKLSAF